MVKLTIDPKVIARVYGVRQVTPLPVIDSPVTGSANTRSLQALDIQTDPTFSHGTTPPASAITHVPTIKPQAGKLSLPTPQSYTARTGWVPIKTAERFVELHRKRDEEREAYLHHGRRNRPSLDRATRANLAERNAISLPANNMHARVRYALITATHVQGVVDALPTGMPVFFVTLINGEHTTSLEDAPAFKTSKLTGWVHQVLRGTHYVGMVEAAYFGNLGQSGVSKRGSVSWHAHCIVCGISEAALKRLVAAINKRFSTRVPGVPAADCRLLQRSEVFGHALYMSKGQVAEYLVYSRKRDGDPDPETGEIIAVPTGRFRVRKRDLRPPDAVRMCPVFVDRYIDRLAFAAGEGRAVLHAIRQEALAPFHRWERSSPTRLPKSGGGRSAAGLLSLARGA